MVFNRVDISNRCGEKIFFFKIVSAVVASEKKAQDTISIKVQPTAEPTCATSADL